MLAVHLQTAVNNNLQAFLTDQRFALVTRPAGRPFLNSHALALVSGRFRDVVTRPGRVTFFPFTAREHTHETVFNASILSTALNPSDALDVISPA